MADTKISNEVSADPLVGSELTEIVQAGNNRKTTIQRIADLAAPFGTTGLGITPTAGLNLYISKAGFDTGNCQSSASPGLTINYALTQGLLTHIRGGNLTINFLGAGDWAEDVTINGRLWGDLNLTAVPNIGITWPSMIVLKGNGAANTTISGTGAFGGTLIVSNSAIVGLENLTITGNKNGFQSPIFVQLQGYLHIFHGVTIGAASAEQLHSENPGSSIQIWEDYTLTGGGLSAFGAADQADILISAGQGTISGTPNYSVAFIFLRSGGTFQSNIATPWLRAGGGAISGAITGKPFEIISGVMEIPSTDLSNLPGSLHSGQVLSGGVVRASIASTTPTAPVTGGIGSTGTVVVDSDSTPKVGRVVITPGGTGISSGGFVDLVTPYSVATEQQGPGKCVACVEGQGSGNFGNPIFLSTSYTFSVGGIGTLNLAWQTANPLTAGLTYTINYILLGGN